jgi:hypothetical protein
MDSVQISADRVRAKLNLISCPSGRRKACIIIRGRGSPGNDTRVVGGKRGATSERVAGSDDYCSYVGRTGLVGTCPVRVSGRVKRRKRRHGGSRLRRSACPRLRCSLQALRASFAADLTNRIAAEGTGATSRRLSRRRQSPGCRAKPT